MQIHIKEELQNLDRNDFMAVNDLVDKIIFDLSDLLVDVGDEYIEGLVSMAEAMSYKICEVCGNKREANKGGWITTLCEAHRK
jgi:hypothetical protein